MGDYNVTPIALDLVPRTIAPRDTLHPLDWVKVRPVWPTAPITSGIAGSATATTMTVAGGTWVTNYRGMWVRLTGMEVKLDDNNIRNIASTTDHVLTLDGSEVFTSAQQAYLNAGGAYEIGPSGPVESLELVGDERFGIRNEGTDQDDVPQTNYGYLVAGSSVSGDPFDSVIYTFRFDATHRMEVTYSHKASMIVGIRSVLSGPGYSYDLSWLMRLAPAGLGASLGGASFWREFIDGLNGQLHMLSNPTYGGAEARPFLDYGGANPGTPLVRLIPSPPILGAQIIVEGGPGIGKICSAVRPLEWDADGRVNPTQNHGGTPRTYALYQRQRQVESLIPHILAGSPFLHLRTQWNYDPARRDYTRYGPIGQHQFDIGGAICLDASYQEAYWLDPVTGVLTPFNQTMFSTGIGDSWSAWIDGSWVIPYGAPGAITGAGPFTSGYGAVVIRKTTGPNAGFTIAAACKLRELNFTTLDRNATPTSVSVALSRSAPNTWTGDPLDDPRFVVITTNSFTYRNPEPGWTGMPHLLYAGPFTQVVATLQNAYAAGLLDAPSDIEAIPPAALIGTELEGANDGIDVMPIGLAMSVRDAEFSGGIQFIPEDGSGLSDANSYATLDQANEYFTLLGDPIAWASATEEKQQQALITATHEMDLRYALRWSSTPATDTQALAHPQGAIYNLLGQLITVPPLPQSLVHGCCEAALKELQAPGSLRQQTGGASTSAGATLRAGPFSFSSSSGISSSTTSSAWQKVDQILVSGGVIVSGLWAQR